MEKKRMPLQHKIIFGYIILVAVIGSMIAILIYERRQMREVEGGVARLWRMYEDIYTTHRHVTGLALQGEAAAGWSDAERRWRTIRKTGYGHGNDRQEAREAY